MKLNLHIFLRLKRNANELTKIGREAVMTQSSMPTEPLKSGFLSKRNDPLCRLCFAGGIFTINYPTGSWMKCELIKLMRHCF